MKIQRAIPKIVNVLERNRGSKIDNRKCGLKREGQAGHSRNIFNRKNGERLRFLSFKACGYCCPACTLAAFVPSLL
jgi:hypothetical protein